MSMSRFDETLSDDCKDTQFQHVFVFPIDQVLARSC